MDNKNVFIAIALSMSVLLFWAAFFESPKPVINQPNPQQKKVNENKDSVAFSIFPSQIEDVMRVADNNLTMPPKSTWFDPKPLDGLVVYEFNQEKV